MATTSTDCNIEAETESLEKWFTYHAPKGDQPARYVAIREAAKNLAKVIFDNVPPSADRTAALRKVREAVMTANAAIACEEC